VSVEPEVPNPLTPRVIVALSVIASSIPTLIDVLVITQIGRAHV